VNADGRRAVLVTGAADGIGRGIAAAFAAAGDRVTMVDYDADKLRRAADALTATDPVRAAGGSLLPLAADVRDPASVEAAFAEAASRHGSLDVAVSNAGVYPNTPVLEMDVDEWDRVLDTNLKGAFLVARAAARRMVDQGGGGKICTIASGAYRSARIGAAHYCASKAGLVLFSQVLALELAEHKINVNVVSPGFVDVGDRPGVSAPYRAAIERTIPWGRTGTPEDIARAVLFVCSREADFMTGAVVPVDGGSSAGRFNLPKSG
jgi:3-oxoacyl-[acyl-carrier protein] reductase